MNTEDSCNIYNYLKHLYDTLRYLNTKPHDIAMR